MAALGNEGQVMRRAARDIRWWHWGLIGGCALSIATAQKVLGAIPSVLAGSMPLREFLLELPLFALGIFTLGFVCGVVGWAVWRVLRRTGRFADAVVGAVVLCTFLLLCYWWFDGPRDWAAVILFCTFGVVVGGVVGFTTGGKMREDAWEEQRRRERAERLSARLPSRTPSGIPRTHADTPPRQRGW